MKNNLTLTSLEAHLASICVAIVSGGIGGVLAKIIFTIICSSYNDLSVSFVYWHGLSYAGVLGFCVSWIVCDCLFKSAHDWYGAKSWYHRVYDLVGIVSGIGVYCVIL